MNGGRNAGMAEAIRMAGGQVRLGHLLGRSQASIARWLYGRPPIKKALEIEVKLGVPRHLLRPDFFAVGP